MTDTLFDMEPRAGQLHNIFFAAVPPEAVALEMADAWKVAGTKDAFRRDTLHMSVLGVMTVEKIDRDWLSRLQKIVADQPLKSFDGVLDRMMTFGGKPGSRALVVTAPGQSDAVNELATHLVKGTVLSGVAPLGTHKPTPHVTLAYGVGFPETRMLPTPIRWTVTELVLIDSLIGKGRHMPLLRWPLV